MGEIDWTDEDLEKLNEALKRGAAKAKNWPDDPPRMPRPTPMSLPKLDPNKAEN